MSAVQHLTIHGLEDQLVVEIMQEERGACEAPHGKWGLPGCGVTVEAIFTTACSNDSRLVCSPVVSWITDAMEVCRNSDCPCGRPALSCWSVVMLP